MTDADNYLSTDTERVLELSYDYQRAGKTVYDRVDRFKDEHEHCHTDSSSDGRVWTVFCPEHDAVIVFEE